ncbi:MAG: PorT family protein [Tannerella sp.]|nr:PorT family protein [Tannerella sp.]
MDKRDKWDDIVRMKSESFEMEPEPEDWEAIAERLSRKKKNALPEWWRYAAAVAALFVLAAGGYYLFRPQAPSASLTAETPANGINVEPENVIGRVTPDTAVASRLLAVLPAAEKTVSSQTSAIREAAVLPEAGNETAPEIPFIAENREKETGREANGSGRAPQTPEEDSFAGDKLLIVDAAPAKRHSRRWGFGVGGGSYSVGNTGAGSNVMPLGATGMHSLNADYSHILTLREMSASAETKHNVTHQRPLSFGLGVGYALNNRWTLQSGLSYSMLTSRWDVLGVNSGRAKQQLHFIGVPLAANYTVVEWNRFRLYTAVGGTAEWNVSGRIKTNYYDYNSGSSLDTRVESVRMKELQFSLNGHAGVSYPLLRFLNAYVEGGADYYFRNGSSLETIRSDKPFQLSLQAGIRFGF